MIFPLIVVTTVTWIMLMTLARLPFLPSLPSLPSPTSSKTVLGKTPFSSLGCWKIKYKCSKTLNVNVQGIWRECTNTATPSSLWSSRLRMNAANISQLTALFTSYIFLLLSSPPHPLLTVGVGREQCKYVNIARGSGALELGGELILKEK